ncbi:MAG: hypothetical protein AAFQ83_24570 [Bacteroidota bacterium]
MHQIIPQGIRRAILILLSVWLICCTCSPAAFAYEEKTDQAPTLTYAPAVTFGVADTGFKLPSFDFDFDFGGIFEESSAFPTGSKVIQFGLGLGSTVNLKQLSAELNLIDARRRIPHLSFLYERQIGPTNVGAGVIAGYQMWSVPSLSYRYHYYTLGVRGSYHFNVDALPELDPYVALGFSLRMMTLTNGPRGETEAKVTAHMILGARYYFQEKMAAFFEIGQDATSALKFGVAYQI